MPTINVDNFWNTCEFGSIRHAVAEFIDHSPVLSNLKGDDYYALEDGIVDLMKQYSQKIADKIDNEFKRLDVLSELCSSQGISYEEACERYPSEWLDRVIERWDHALSNNPLYYDGYWESLKSTLAKEDVDSIKNNVW